MIRTVHIALLIQMLLGGAGREPAAEYVRIERLSKRVLLAYWLGTGRCNLTAINTEKGLVVIDTEICPRLLKTDLRPVLEYYQNMFEDGRAARQQGLTLEQATERMSVRNGFPEFREPQPGDWAHGMQERNVRNLWRILQQEEQQPKTQQTKQPD